MDEDKKKKKLLELEISTILIAWFIFFLIFTIKGGWRLGAEKATAMLCAAAITSLVAVLVVVVSAVLGKAELFATSIVIAGFSVSASYFANFHFSFVALAVMCLLTGWLILKMASTETDKKKMQFSAVSLGIQGLLFIAPILFLIFGQ